MRTDKKEASRVKKRLTSGSVKLASVILAMILLFGAFPARAADFGGGQFDFDVMFVLDYSGSMRTSDPSKLARSASTLFTNMCGTSDSRAGYVMYSHEIVKQSPLRNLTDIESKNAIINEISGTEYTAGGDTDIALGLREAYSLLTNDAEYGNRKPVIVLLSDGNTDLSPNKTDRTVEESLSELDTLKVQYAEKGIPIYTIGFNYNGSLNMDIMENIANVTNAFANEATSADQLQRILSDIYADLSDARRNVIFDGVATGQPQTVEIPIPNNYISKAVVTISSSEPASAIDLTDPNNGLVNRGAYTIDADPLKKYTLVTIPNPTAGTWQMQFTGKKDASVNITLISVYDLNFDLKVEMLNVSGDTKFSGIMSDGNGSIVDYRNLFPDADVKLYIELPGGALLTHTAPNGSTVDFLMFTPGENSVEYTLEPDTYTAYLTLSGNEVTKDSNEVTFTIDPITPIRSTGSTYIESKLWILILKKENEVPLSQVVSYTQDNLPLSVKGIPDDGAWADVFDWNYDSKTGMLTVSSVKAGSGTTDIVVTGVDGSTLTLTLDTVVRSGLIVIIGAAALLLVLLVVAFIIMQQRKPYLNDPLRDFRITVEMPSGMDELAPPETTLTLPHQKDAITLKALIEYNGAASTAYNEAFYGLDWFTTGLKFKAKKKDFLEVTVPSGAGYSVKVNNTALAQTGYRLQRGGGLAIMLINDNGAYEIMLGEHTDNNGDNNYGNDFDFEAGPTAKNTSSGFDDFDF